jgi:hypothetical protein
MKELILYSTNDVIKERIVRVSLDLDGSDFECHLSPGQYITDIELVDIDLKLRGN